MLSLNSLFHVLGFFGKNLNIWQLSADRLYGSDLFLNKTIFHNPLNHFPTTNIYIYIYGIK